MYLKIKNIIVVYIKHRKHETGKIVCKWIVEHLGSVVLCVSYGWYFVLRFLESPNLKHLKLFYTRQIHSRR